VRGIDAGPAVECAFLHPALDQPGRWFGGCEAGLAAGPGYGLLMEADGPAIEYVGAARAGLAEGDGAMILHTPSETGAVYFEGAFSGGVPDGVVQVEEPGRKSRVRTFRAGRDAGAAAAEDLRRVAF
jgi:hypothetical protein